ncbi:MAG: hypothetical protein WCP55_00445 [Lentisphaerota bacterium]
MDDVIRVVGEYFKLEKTDKVVVRKGAIMYARQGVPEAITGNRWIIA